MDDLPDAALEELQALLGKPCFVEVAPDVIEAGAIRFFAAAVEDGSPSCWTENPEELEAPPAMLSVWSRPPLWQPGQAVQGQAMALHFLLKEKLGLPRAVVVEAESEVSAPMRPGVQVKSQQILLALGPLTTTKLGRGRYWRIRVEYLLVGTDALLGAEELRFFGYAPEDAA